MTPLFVFSGISLIRLSILGAGEVYPRYHNEVRNILVGRTLVFTVDQSRVEPHMGNNTRRLHPCALVDVNSAPPYLKH